MSDFKPGDFKYRTGRQMENKLQAACISFKVRLSRAGFFCPDLSGFFMGMH
jgi:hypothetical protein